MTPEENLALNDEFLACSSSIPANVADAAATIIIVIITFRLLFRCRNRIKFDPTPEKN